MSDHSRRVASPPGLEEARPWRPADPDFLAAPVRPAFVACFDSRAAFFSAAETMFALALERGHSARRGILVRATTPDTVAVDTQPYVPIAYRRRHGSVIPGPAEKRSGSPLPRVGEPAIRAAKCYRTPDDVAVCNGPVAGAGGPWARATASSRKVSSARIDKVSR